MRTELEWHCEVTAMSVMLWGLRQFGSAKNENT